MKKYHIMAVICLNICISFAASDVNSPKQDLQQTFLAVKHEKLYYQASTATTAWGHNITKTNKCSLTPHWLTPTNATLSLSFVCPQTHVIKCEHHAK